MVNNLPEISVVLPCLNEEKTITYCIEKALIGIQNSNLIGEVIVADNGSSDKSIILSQQAGAKVVNVTKKGYGSALRGGIEAAKGKFIIMGDSDSTYNFEDIPFFVEKLDEDFDLVVGNRFIGGIEKGAMPILNKYLGNPLLSFIAKKLFNTSIGDFHCGLRGFTKKAYAKMNLKSEGMEFATEMIAKSSLLDLKIAEVPTTLSISIYPRTPHLKPFRDGFRHLYLMLTYSFIKLFKKSFNIGLFLLLPIYLSALIFTPYKIGNLTLSLGFVNFAQNLLLIILILRSMLSLNSSLLPEFLEDNKENKYFNNLGIVYVILGIVFYVLDLFYWSSKNFGFINQNINIKILSVASLFLTYGIFETFKSVFIYSIEYFKKE